MRIETIPLILGILIGLLGIGIIFDAWTPDAASVVQERRRRPRIERHRNGEALIGFGVLALAAAFIGRDNWRYSVLVVIIGAALLVFGAVLNARYVRELFVNRGPLRRRDSAEAASGPAAPRATEPVSTPGELRDEPVIEESPSRGERNWDGTERRKTPREGNRKPPRRGQMPEDTPRS